MWYSRSIFNFQPTEIKQLFRKIETKSKQLIINNLHQEFNSMCIFIYVCIYILSVYTYVCIYIITSYTVCTDASYVRLYISKMANWSQGNCWNTILLNFNCNSRYFSFRLCFWVTQLSSFCSLPFSLLVHVLSLS